MSTTIDSFVNIPILITVAASFLILIMLLISKIRNTSKVSMLMYVVIAFNVAGLLYTYKNQHLIYLVFTMLASEFILLVYSFVLAISDPVKKAKKLSQKEKEENLNLAEINKEELQKINDKYNSILAVSNDLTAKAASFFSAEDSLTSFLDYFNKLIIEKTNADGCAILIYDNFDDILSVKSLNGKFPPPYKLPEDLPHKPIRVETNFKFSQFNVSGNIFGDIFTEGKIVNVKDPIKDHHIYQNTPEDFLKCGPYLFVPMMQDGETVALICISRACGREEFSEEDIEIASNLVNACSTAMRPLNSFISYAEHSELTKEGDIATKFQKTLLPEKMPVINKLSIGKYSIAQENVCGDYYDIIPSRKDRITFVMSDVAGKGMNSLVIMIMIRAMLRLVANTNQSSATLLEWVNKAICSEKNSMDHFASVSIINYNSIDNTAQIAASGSNPVILYSAQDKSIKKITTDCEPIGVEKSTNYKDIDISLNAGDILITCTDGILECLNENGVQFSLDRLQNIIFENASLSGKDIANKVKDNIKKFCGTTQQYDDQSLLVVKIQG